MELPDAVCDLGQREFSPPPRIQAQIAAPLPETAVPPVELAPHAPLSPARCPIALRACYPVSGTDIVYGAMRYQARCVWDGERLGCALSGIELANAAPHLLCDD
eukprot:193770-Rhodomonas_salina.1